MFYKILNVVRMHLALTFRTMFSRPADPNFPKSRQNRPKFRRRAFARAKTPIGSERPRPDCARSDRHYLHVNHPPRASLTFAEPLESRIPSQNTRPSVGGTRRRPGRGGRAPSPRRARRTLPSRAIVLVQHKLLTLAYCCSPTLLLLMFLLFSPEQCSPLNVRML